MNSVLRDEFSGHKWSPPSRSSVASFICEARYSITGMKKFMECGTKCNFTTEKKLNTVKFLIPFSKLLPNLFLWQEAEQGAARVTLAAS